MTAHGRLVGRTREVATVLNRLRSGTGTVIVGVAGVGKSAVAAEVRARLRAANETTVFIGCADGAGATVPVLSAEVTRSAAVFVDDAHLLDLESAQQLSCLLAGAGARVVATVRVQDTPVPALGWLWAAGACERLELRPLPADDVFALLEHHLRGPVDDQLSHLVIERTRGNPLLVGELLDAGVRSGAIATRHGVWQLTDELPLTGAVVDLIRQRVAGLDEPRLAALQMVALAQPLRVTVADRAAARAVWEDLETGGLIVATGEGQQRSLSCAHPLYGEVLRADLGSLRSGRLQGVLLDAMAGAPATTDREGLLAASWRLDRDEPVRPEDLLGHARIAATAHPVLAERLLRAILDSCGDERTGATVDAALVLAELLVIQGRVAEADEVVNRLENGDATFLDGRQRTALDTVRVLVRTRLGAITEALQLVGATAEHESTVRKQVLYAQLMLLTARLDEAVRIGGPVVEQRGADPVARAVAAYTVVAAHSFAGRGAATADAMSASLPALAAARESVPYGTAMAEVSSAIADVFAGRFAAAARLGQRMHDTARDVDDPWSRPRAATVLGLVALYRGRPGTAATHLADAVAALTPLDAMFVRYNLAFLARAAALAGNLADAERALRAPTDAPVFALYEADWQIAQAAVLAARHDLDGAARHAMSAARTAADRGQWGIAAIAAHDAARYTGNPEAATFLTSVADLLDGPLPPVMRDHAVGRAAGDAALLSSAGAGFERLGATVFAAEASYAAAHALRSQGARDAAAEQAARATRLHGSCAPAYLPWAVGPAANELTTRELEVALLAAAGHSDRHISGQLDISLRTVQTHLTRVYTKLHLRTRTQLAAALAGDVGQTVRHAGR